MSDSRIICGDCVEVLGTLADNSVHCVVTSPPYWGLRDYGVEGQMGLEKTPAEFIAKMVAVFAEVRRVLREDGVCWVNMGDSYAAQRSGTAMPAETLAGGFGGQVVNGRGSRGRGDVEPDAVDGRAKRTAGTGPRHRDAAAIGLKHKDLCGIPWRLALALQADGWWLRQDIIWHKPNPMPESVTDRCTKAHEYVFLLTKAARYFYDAEAVREPVIPDARDTKWDTHRSGRSMVDHAQDAVKGRHGVKTQADGWVRMSNPAGRNRRSVWTIATEAFAEAHFATFPTKMVEPCVKAGTSERGCCPVCGAPWVRVVDRKAMVIDRSERTHDKGRTRASGTMVEPPKSTTVGWQPSCGCGVCDDEDIGGDGCTNYPPEPIACTVLDPFAGAGTTGLVANRLGRDFVGIELNPDYAAMARKRIAADAPLLNDVEVTR